MRPPQEKLTRKQLYFCSGIMAATFVAFSSVFAYAYIKGAQMRVKSNQAEAAHLNLCGSATSSDIRKKASRIMQGHRGQANNTFYREVAAASTFWTINKLPMIKSVGLQPASPVVACSKSRAGWAVYPTGVVQVPQNAEPGLYTLQCSAGEYLFEVVPERRPNVKRTLHQTSTSRKIVHRDTMRFTSDIALTPASAVQDMEEW